MINVKADDDSVTVEYDKETDGAVIIAESTMIIDSLIELTAHILETDYDYAKSILLGTFINVEGLLKDSSTERYE